jgi:hypothetical protein
LLFSYIPIYMTIGAESEGLGDFGEGRADKEKEGMV